MKKNWFSGKSSSPSSSKKKSKNDNPQPTRNQPTDRKKSTSLPRSTVSSGTSPPSSVALHPFKDNNIDPNLDPSRLSVTKNSNPQTNATPNQRKYSDSRKSDSSSKSLQSKKGSIEQSPEDQPTENQDPQPKRKVSNEPEGVRAQAPRVSWNLRPRDRHGSQGSRRSSATQELSEPLLPDTKSPANDPEKQNDSKNVSLQDTRRTSGLSTFQTEKDDPPPVDLDKYDTTPVTTIQLQSNSPRTSKKSVPTVQDVIAMSQRRRSSLRDDGPELRKDQGDTAIVESQGNVFSGTVYERKYSGGSGSQRSSFSERNTHLVTLATLYKEALYTSIHFLGTPTTRLPSTKDDLCFYSHIAFKADKAHQVATMEHVVNEPFPLTVVNVKIRRAVGVLERDNDEPPSTYCLVTVETDPSPVDFQVDAEEWQRITTKSPIRPKPVQKNDQRPPPEKRTDQVYEQVPSFIKTSLQPSTRNPSWDQRFQCLALRPSVDKLVIELWDKESDGGNELSNRSSKRRIKKGDVFLGKIFLPVRNIPCEGEAKWHAWKGETQRKRPAAGKLLTEVWLTHAYRHGKHFNDYAEPRIMLETFWNYVLSYESSRFPTNWSGDIPPAATSLLFQYALQTGISEACQAIVRWNAYAKYNLGLHALGKRLTELELSLNRTKDRKDVSDCQLQKKLIMVAIDKILPVLRNHLNEKQEHVLQAVKALRHCAEILSKFGMTDHELVQVNFWIQAEIRMAILEWYQAKYRELMGCFRKADELHTPAEIVEIMARLVNEVNMLLRNCRIIWTPLFIMDGGFDYMPLAYDELQKMIIHDVERVCWDVIQDFDTNEKLREALVNFNDEVRRLCKALFNLYIETQVFVHEQENIFDDDVRKKYYHLNQYHRWFRPVLVLWLGYALIRASDMIATSIKIDVVAVENTDKQISSSAIDAGMAYSQLTKFWQQLNWADVAEGYCIIQYLFEVMCFITVLYARQKRHKLETEGYFDTEDRFDISERLCTSLNNIEHVKESLVHIPEEIQMDSILVELDRVIGESDGQQYRLRVNKLLTCTLAQVEHHFKRILTGVAERVRPEVREFVKQSFSILKTPNMTDDDALVPILSYLEDNIIVLHNSLLELNFVRVLQMLWDVTCQEILHELILFIEAEDMRKQEPFFERIESCIVLLVNYFQGGQEGLNETEIETQHYGWLKTFLSCISMPTELLVAAYYRIAGEEQIGPLEPSALGTLTARITYWDEELKVEIMSAKNLSARDIPPKFIKKCWNKEDSSDPMVHVSLRPRSLFSFAGTEQKTTKTQWKTQNPVFNETFAWKVPYDVCEKPEAVVVLTVMDYDAVSRNDFLGEAIVPLSQVPGVKKMRPLAQPMTLQLRSVNLKEHPVLVILANRHWDNDALEFVSELKRKVVVIKNPKKPITIHRPKRTS